MNRVLILLFCLPFISLAQNKPLMVEGAYPELYVNHTVQPKENYYSIGRMYNVSPKEIAPFNHLELEKGLSIKQEIKIPLTESNFSQNGGVDADEVLVPLYHSVKEKEGLYRISTSYNKVPLETLKKWNNLKSDVVSNGTKLIIGYLKVKKDLSALAGMAKPVPVVSAPPAEEKEKQTTTKTPAKPDISNETLPVVKNPAKEKESETKTVVAKEKESETKTTVIKEAEPVKPASSGNSIKNFNGGYFKKDFDKQSKNSSEKNETGVAGIFKSTSGWEDGKYYCLHNSASPGTILKITSTATGKSIYAKVLDVIPDMSQNNGLLIRLSNAAAADLGVTDNKFDCSISFSK